MGCWAQVLSVCVDKLWLLNTKFCIFYFHNNILYTKKDKLCLGTEVNKIGLSDLEIKDGPSLGLVSWSFSLRLFIFKKTESTLHPNE